MTKRIQIGVLALAVFTAAYPRWLESVGLNLDHGSGTAEVALVAACLVLALVLSFRLVTRHPQASGRCPDPGNSSV